MYNQIYYLIEFNLKEYIEFLGVKNLNLTKFAHKFNIPIYSLKSIDFYQLTRLFINIS